MKRFKKILKITGISLLVFIIILFLIPILFKKQITRLVKKEINRSLTAKVDFKDVRLSLLRHFPKVTIILEDFSIVGDREFKGDTLVYAKSIDASANIFSIIKGKNIKIYGAYLQSPRINAIVNADGKMNWDIARKTTSESSDTSASSFQLSLKNYEINNGYINFRDEQAGINMEWEDVDHSGSGNIMEDEFTLSTVTHAKEASYTQDGIPYLARTKADIITDIKVDNRTMTYTFNTDKMKLNDLQLSLKGFFQVVNDSTYKMDVTFQSPNNQFRNILSLIPDIYKKDFEKLQATGEAAFNGFVKGTYRPGWYPSYDIDLLIKNGSFKYPDLPKSVKNIHLDLKATNDNGDPDHAIINVTNGHLEMDKEPFDFKFIYKNPETARYIDAAAKGKLDLSELTQFIKLNKGTKLSGIVAANAWAKGNMKALQNLSGNFSAGGFFDIRNLFYSSSDFPQPIRNGNIKATLENTGGIADQTAINVSSGHIELGNDPLDFTLRLTNPVTTVDFAGHVKGRFVLDHLQQFTKLEPGTSLSGLLNTDLDIAGSKNAIVQKQYDKILLNGAASVSQLKYKSAAYPSGIQITNGQLLFNDKSVDLSQLSGNYMNSNFAATGVLNNLVGYMMDQGALNGELNVSADKVNLNDWIGTTSATPSPATAPAANSKPFLVPADMNFTLHTNISKVTYDKVDYSNVKGELTMKDEKINFKNVNMQALDGDVTLNGSYSTLINKKEPDIGFSYDIKDMDVQKAFYAFNTIQSIMPIGKFLSGKLNSQLSMVGKMQPNMFPKLMSLTGKGNLLLLKGVLMKFAPLEKLANVLQIDRLRSISLKELKNYFEFANGKVLIKPFTVKIDDIEMLISGLHGFDQSIDYAIKMKLPRRLMGSKGNEFVNGLASKINDKGIPLKLGETISLDIKMTGTFSNPFIGINLAGMVDDVVKDMEQQAKDFAQAKLDSAKQKAKDSLELVKKVLADKLKDKLKQQVFGKDTTATPDSNKKKPTSIIKNTIKDIFRRKNKSDTL